ncbi:inositol monophosphatase family protein [Bosea minatitlanensis]|uniref:Inositol monophosphatase family protein n=1 Tax=Bosea minatitlanensis TaxID=128782 RepID=A0ABW0F2W8_9HYPH|nr:inositol monophosphatase family protein [Bosea minatitlanensis]MCT4492598.1 inositol monophosphatase family protein [Bosea minatitlanensis]
MPTSDIRNFIAFAQEMAEASGAIIREAAGRINAFDSKGDDSPVTEIDRRVETELRRRIGEAFPEHGIQGEEFGAQATGADYVWVLDPIDGTKAFVAGIPVFGTLIALAHRGVPVLGVIDQPMTRERWIGADGFPTTLNGRRVATSGRTVLSEAVLSTSNIELYDPASLPVFEALRSSVHWCVYGGSCYAYGRLASGGIDVAIDRFTTPHDVLAHVPVIANAGGVITDWEGAPLTLHSSGRCLAAANPALHRAALDRIARRRPAGTPAA